MLMLQFSSFILIAILLISMLATARPRMKAPLPGKPLHTLPVGFRPKLAIYRSTLLALMTGCGLTVAVGWLPLNMAMIVAAIALMVFLIPMQYTLTTQGVGVGDGIFRPWSDFSGFKAKKSSLELASPSNFGRLTLFIKPAEMDNVLKYVQRHVKPKSSNSSIEGE
jgi:hypothetical protein